MKNVFSPAFISGILAAVIATSCAPVSSESAKTAEPASQTQEERVPAPTTKASGKIEVLSRHDTNAVFQGARRHVCMGRSMLCPDRCGHSGTLAVFKIENYNKYEQFGKYGDPQTDEFIFMLKSTTGESDVPPALAEKIAALKPGDKVRLVWEHVYVSDENGARPERPVRVLESE
ncbi:MAG: hypothetical protein E7037_05185 [Verrucomicrobia bacterium]|nr:hypothetical protein [Verrucomicrobiota bacterium]